MSGYFVRWKHPQFGYQHGEDRFAEEQSAVWATAAYRERGCQATCFEIADDGSEGILPIITWKDRIDLAVFRAGVHRADSTPVTSYLIRVVEGGDGAIEVSCHWEEPLGMYKPNWQVKRWVSGAITVMGDITPATEAIARLVAQGDWQPMSWRAWEGSKVQLRDRASGETFSSPPFEQTAMNLLASGVPA